MGTNKLICDADGRIVAFRITGENTYAFNYAWDNIYMATNTQGQEYPSEIRVIEEQSNFGDFEFGDYQFDHQAGTQFAVTPALSEWSE